MHFKYLYLYLLLEYLIKVCFLRYILLLVCLVCFYASAALLHQRHYVFALSFPACVPCHGHFFRFARILNVFRWNLRGIMSTTNDDYILGKIGTGIQEQDTTENPNRCQLVFCRDVKQVLTPSADATAAIISH